MSKRNDRIDHFISDQLASVLDQADHIDYARRKLAREFVAPRRPRRWARWPLAAAAGACCLAAVGALIYAGSAREQAPRVLAQAGGAPVAKGDVVSVRRTGVRHIRFADGSAMTLGDDASLGVDDMAPGRVTLRLHRGAVDATIVHTPNKRWQMRAGPFRVVITGTRFRISWDPSSRVFALQMRAGSVVVDGPPIPDGVVLADTDSLRIDRRSGTTVVERGSPPPSPPAPDVAISPRGGPTDNDRHSAVRRPAHRAVPRSLPKGASASGGVRGTAAPVQKTRKKTNEGKAPQDETADIAECEKLLQFADAARLSGQVAAAEQAYKTIRKRFPLTAPAAKAAFALGRIDFDRRRFAAAASWFRTCIADAPGGPLTREATGRLMESLYRSGNAADAARVAKDYLENYPNGPHSGLAQKIVSHGATD